SQLILAKYVCVCFLGNLSFPYLSFKLLLVNSHSNLSSRSRCNLMSHQFDCHTCPNYSLPTCFSPTLGVHTKYVVNMLVICLMNEEPSSPSYFDFSLSCYNSCSY
ncbi:hypothetical protein H1C71_027130, partial [Ictidomys tridecemlineatus]